MLCKLRYASKQPTDLPHPEMMEMIDTNVANSSYQLTRSAPLDVLTLSNNTNEMLDSTSTLLRQTPNTAELHVHGRPNGNANQNHYRSLTKRDSPKQYVTFDGHSSFSSNMQHHSKSASAAHANYVPVIYKPQTYQRAVCNGNGNGNDRQRASVTSPLNWATEEAEI